MKMKKNNLLILAVAALGFAACSSDETTAVNEKLAESNAISFRPLVGGNMRAASAANVTTANLTSFVVNAMIASSETSYFSNATFTGSGDPVVFTSDPKYYWPATESLDFYAYAPSGNSQITYTNYKTFTVEPTSGENPASQVDFVYAATKGKTRASNASGVVLNFRHTGAKIVCQVKNGSSTLKFGVEGWKVGFLSPSGTFTFADTNTDGQNTGTGTTLTDGQWDNWAAASVATEYASTFTKKLLLQVLVKQLLMVR